MVRKKVKPIGRQLAILDAVVWGNLRPQTRRCFAANYRDSDKAVGGRGVLLRVALSLGYDCNHARSLSRGVDKRRRTKWEILLYRVFFVARILRFPAHLTCFQVFANLQHSPLRRPVG